MINEGINDTNTIDKRTYPVNIRLTKKEYSSIKQIAKQKKMKVSDYIRYWITIESSVAYIKDLYNYKTAKKDKLLKSSELFTLFLNEYIDKPLKQLLDLRNEIMTLLNKINSEIQDKYNPKK